MDFQRSCFRLISMLLDFEINFDSQKIGLSKEILGIALAAFVFIFPLAPDVRSMETARGNNKTIIQN